MTNVIAILLLAGNFHVAVESSAGYLEASYADTPAGVAQFVSELRAHLKNEEGRFFPCLAYDDPALDPFAGALYALIGPGAEYATSVLGPAKMAQWKEQAGTTALDARAVEAACAANFPRDYKVVFPPRQGARELYQAGAPLSEEVLLDAARCEALATGALTLEASQDTPTFGATARAALIGSWIDWKLGQPRRGSPVYDRQRSEVLLAIKEKKLTTEERQTFAARCEEISRMATHNE